MPHGKGIGKGVRRLARASRPKGGIGKRVRSIAKRRGASRRRNKKK